MPRRTTIANVVRIEAHGAYHTLARTRSGQIFAWGNNTYGEIGNGTTINQLIPPNISAAAGTGGSLGTNIAVFGAGVFSSFALNALQAATPTGASTLRGDQFSIIFPASTVAGTTEIRIIDPTATGLTVPAGYTILAHNFFLAVCSGCRTSFADGGKRVGFRQSYDGNRSRHLKCDHYADKLAGRNIHKAG